MLMNNCFFGVPVGVKGPKVDATIMSPLFSAGTIQGFFSVAFFAVNKTCTNLFALFANIFLSLSASQAASLAASTILPPTSMVM